MCKDVQKPTALKIYFSEVHLNIKMSLSKPKTKVELEDRTFQLMEFLTAPCLVLSDIRPPGDSAPPPVSLSRSL